MGSRAAVRPGGRSARVQQAVHEAVNELDNEVGREKLSVPLIAERAGVTPSTIYRRWGNLNELMADVAADRLQPDALVPDTGTLEGDLMAWASEYMEEMTSTPGQQMMADTLGSTSLERRQRCLQWQHEQLQLILSRAERRGEESLPSVDTLLDGIMAPLTYRLSYAPQTLSKNCLLEWISKTLAH